MRLMAIAIGPPWGVFLPFKWFSTEQRLSVLYPRCNQGACLDGTSSAVVGLGALPTYLVS
jgi:hypothetical protein